MASAPLRLILIGLVAALAGCGGGDTPSLTLETTTGSDDAASEFFQTSNRTHQRAEQECSTFGAEGIAKTYGGQVGDNLSLALAYAEATTQKDFQADAEEGCLAGLGG